MFSFLDSTFLVPSLKSLKLHSSHLLAINVLQTCLSALHLFKERLCAHPCPDVGALGLFLGT